MRSTFSMALAFGTILLSPMVAGAQATPPMIPTVLVATGLAPFGQDFASNLTVGRTPRGWPAMLTPPSPARLIGGSAFGPLTQVVVSYPKGVDGRASLQSMLQRFHFQRADTVNTAPATGFGTSILLEHSHMAWCSDSTVAAVIPADSVKFPRTWVLLAIREPASVRRCHGQVDDNMGHQQLAALHVPPLRPPAGVRVQALGTNSSTESFSVSAYADTTISADSLLLHYASELRRGGWTQLGAPAITTGAGLVPFSARDPNGDEWKGTLIVISATSRLQVGIQMWTGSTPGGGF